MRNTSDVSLKPIIQYYCFYYLNSSNALFIDRKGGIREIHTGFSGPGTGEPYYIYKEETEKLVVELLEDKL